MPYYEIESILGDFVLAKEQVYVVPAIREVSRTDVSTTIYWEDGTKTSVRCGQGETYDKYNGFTAAVCKKLFGSTTAAKHLSNRLDTDELKRIEKEKRELIEAEAKRKRMKREKAIVKRWAKEIVLQKQAEHLAMEMMKKEGE